MLKKIIHKIEKEKAFLFEKKGLLLPNSEKIISFTFDDFPKSAYTNALKVLETYDLYGTFYASMGLVGTQSDSDNLFSNNDLSEIAKKGHEIGCHTYDHINCFYSSQELIIDNCIRNQQSIKDLIGKTTRSIAYPYGDFNLSAKRLIGNLYASARTVKAGINSSKCDLNALKSVPIYRTKEAGIYKWIEKLDKNGGWLIFYTHDVKRNPSPIGCTKDFFQEVVIECVNRKFKIMPVGDVIDAFP